MPSIISPCTSGCNIIIGLTSCLLVLQVSEGTYNVQSTVVVHMLSPCVTLPPSLPVQFYRLLKQQLVAKEWEKSLPPPPKPVQGVSCTNSLLELPFSRPLSPSPSSLPLPHPPSTSSHFSPCYPGSLGVRCHWSEYSIAYASCCVCRA